MRPLQLEPTQPALEQNPVLINDEGHKALRRNADEGKVSHACRQQGRKGAEALRDAWMNMFNHAPTPTGASATCT